MTKLAAVFCLALMTAANAAHVARADVPEPEGFRGPPYNAEVPATLTGAKVISAEEARALHDKGVPFLDVLPQQARPKDLPEGTIWHVAPHLTIPGAIWLYDTGYEALAPAEEARLSKGLTEVTGGKLDAPVVIFCKANCWMSWNAGKRAVALGYTGINWFPGGVEGWQDAGGTLVRAIPADP